MLRLESVNLVAKALKLFPAIGNNLAPGAPHTFVLATQGEGLLELESVGIEGIHTKISIRSVDTLVGSVYLLPFAETREVLEKLESNYALQIYNQAGANVFDTYIEVVNNQPQILDSTIVSAFSGAIDEFILPCLVEHPVEFKSQTIATAELLTRADKYGDYQVRVGGDRAVLLTVTDGHLIVYAVPQNAPNFYLKQELKVFGGNAENSQPIVILGCHLMAIVNILSTLESDTIEWQLRSNYLTVTCGGNQVTIPLQDIDRFAYLKPISSYFDPDAIGDLVASYRLPLGRSIAAVKAQQPTRSNQRFLKIQDVASGLQLGKLGDLLGREWSAIELFDRQIIQPLPTVVIGSPALLKSLVVLDTYAKKSQLDYDLQLEFYAKSIGARQRWIAKIGFHTHTPMSSLPTMLGSINIEST